MTKISVFVLLCTAYSLVDTQRYLYRSPWGSSEENSVENSVENDGPGPYRVALARSPIYSGPYSVPRSPAYGGYRYGPPSPPRGRYIVPRSPLFYRYDSAEDSSVETSSNEESSYEDRSYENSRENLSPRYYGDYGAYENVRSPYIEYDDEPGVLYRSGGKNKKKAKKGCKKGKKGGKGCEYAGGWWYVWDKKHGYLQGRWGKPPPPGLEKEHYDHGFGHHGHNYGPGYNGWGKIPHKVGPHNHHSGGHGHGGGWGGHHGGGHGHGGGWGGHQGGHHGGHGHGGGGGWGWQPVKDFGWGWAQKVGWGWK